MKLTISICRQSKTFAVFNDRFNPVFGFTPYKTEEKAIQRGRFIANEHGDDNPEIVYPRITSFREVK